MINPVGLARPEMGCKRDRKDAQGPGQAGRRGLNSRPRWKQVVWRPSCVVCVCKPVTAGERRCKCWLQARGNLGSDAKLAASIGEDPGAAGRLPSGPGWGALGIAERVRWIPRCMDGGWSEWLFPALIPEIEREPHCLDSTTRAVFRLTCNKRRRRGQNNQRHRAPCLSCAFLVGTLEKI
jgi:hypothetical protein